MELLNNVKQKRTADAFFGMRMPTATLDALRAAADADRRSVSNYVLNLIERELATTAREGRPAV